jgi:hypothetical protein
MTLCRPGHCRHPYATPAGFADSSGRSAAAASTRGACLTAAERLHHASTTRNAGALDKDGVTRAR